MSKQLSSLTTEEFLALFPVELKPHNPAYGAWYEEERAFILHITGESCAYRINHVGSTAVPEMPAKPIIDILLEVWGGCDMDQLAAAMEAAGWNRLRAREEPLRLVLQKGYTASGFSERVYHLHVRRAGDWGELYFRDYLRANPKVASRYAALKTRLAKKFRHNRDAYTDAKTPFVTEMTEQAKAEYAGRYAL